MDGRESYLRKNILKYGGKAKRNGKTGLIIAIENNQKGIVKLLLPYERNSRDKQGNSALMIAIQYRRENIYEILYTLSPYINKNDNSTALTIAAETCQLKIFSKLLQKEKQLAKVSQRHIDALCGNIRTQQLQSLYVQENSQQDIQGRIPLIYFMFNQHNLQKQNVNDIIKQLLPQNYKSDKYGLYPIHYSIILNFQPVYNVLIDQCGDQLTERKVCVFNNNIEANITIYSLLQQFNRDWGYQSSSQLDIIQQTDEGDELLKSQNLLLRSQNSNLIDKFTASQINYIQLNKVYQKQTEQLQGLKSQINKLQSENIRLQNILSINQIKSTEQLQAQYIFDKNQFQIEVNQLQQDKQTLLKQVENMQIIYANRIKELNQLVKTNKKDIDALKTINILDTNKYNRIFQILKLLQIKQEKSNLYDDQLIQMQQKIDDNLIQIEQLNKQLITQEEEHQDEINSLVVDAAQIQQQLENELQENQTLKQKMQQFEQQIQFQEQQLQQLQKQLKTSQIERETLENQLITKANLISQIDEQMNKIQANNNQLQEQLLQKDIIISQLKNQSNQ